jgi:hypothetical protein
LQLLIDLSLTIDSALTESDPIIDGIRACGSFTVTTIGLIAAISVVAVFWARKTLILIPILAIESYVDALFLSREVIRVSHPRNSYEQP